MGGEDKCVVGKGANGEGYLGSDERGKGNGSVDSKKGGYRPL